MTTSYNSKFYTGELSPREAETWRFMAMGMSDQEIADAMGLHYETARTYGKRIYAKKLFTNRTQAAVAYVREHGFDGIPEPGGM